MKVLALVIFAVASVACSGSGPYLPSGWRPQGPAFYLPSEAEKSAGNPLKDVILSESEASGSDALREYGPPKVVEVSQDLTRQALPQTVTEQAFVVIEAKFTEDEDVKEESEVRSVEEVEEVKTGEVTESVEVTTEQKALEEAVTEVIEDQGTEAVQGVPQGRAIDVKTIDETVETQEVTESEGTTAEVVQVTESVATEVDSDVESSQVDVSQAQAVQEVSQADDIAEIRTVEGVQNVVEALTNLEQEIKAHQVESNEEAVEVKSVQILGSTEEAPEGFLEYGPPGFREYGPPQTGDVRSGAIQEQTEEEHKIEANETRRRRFSPKFRSSRKD